MHSATGWMWVLSFVLPSQTQLSPISSDTHTLTSSQGPALTYTHDSLT
jgi:hypothetical protein